MTDLISSVKDQLGADGLAKIAGMLGTDSGAASGALDTVLGTLTGALARNAAKPEGAAALDAALAKDHDGGIFDNLGGFLGDIAGGPGAGILGHLLGSQQQPVAREIAEQSGLDMKQVMALLATAAPLLMGVLGKKKKEEGLDAGAIAGALSEERKKVEESSGGGLGSLLGMLDGGGGAGGLLSKLMGMFGRKG